MSQANIIPYGRQSISEADIQAVVDVLRSDFLTQGLVVPAFEQAVASYFHARHGVAASNSTAALHIACLALGLGFNYRMNEGEQHRVVDLIQSLCHAKVVKRFAGAAL
jgi:dTDP-4-amino-4,6-dideoxygalactose transaminase